MEIPHFILDADSLVMQTVPGLQCQQTNALHLSTAPEDPQWVQTRQASFAMKPGPGTITCHRANPHCDGDPAWPTRAGLLASTHQLEELLYRLMVFEFEYFGIAL